MTPSFAEEKKLWQRGIEYVVGLDEAGRGPLAGPVVAAAVLLHPKAQETITKQIPNIKDSKKLNERQREECYEVLATHPAVHFGVGVISEKIIDEINILEASKLAMVRALDDLRFKIHDLRRRDFDYLLIDGNFLLKGLDVPQKAIIGGDATVFSITAAGIIAKVTRDFIMHQLHQRYPEYGFRDHKGYGTPSHMARLTRLGPCDIHRKSFFPVNTLAKSELI